MTLSKSPLTNKIKESQKFKVWSLTTKEKEKEKEKATFQNINNTFLYVGQKWNENKICCFFKQKHF